MCVTRLSLYRERNVLHAMEQEHERMERELELKDEEEAELRGFVAFLTQKVSQLEQHVFLREEVFSAVVGSVFGSSLKFLEVFSFKYCINYSVCFAVLLLWLSTIGKKVLQNANEVYCCTSTLQQMACVVILFSSPVLDERIRGYVTMLLTSQGVFCFRVNVDVYTRRDLRVT